MLVIPSVDSLYSKKLMETTSTQIDVPTERPISLDNEDDPFLKDVALALEIALPVAVFLVIVGLITWCCLKRRVGPKSVRELQESSAYMSSKGSRASKG
jgi:hypothetical protein